MHEPVEPGRCARMREERIPSAASASLEELVSEHNYIFILFMGFPPCCFWSFLCRGLGLRLYKDLIVGNIIVCFWFPWVMLVSLKNQWLKRDNGILSSKLGVVNKLFPL